MPVRIFSPRGCHLIAMFARTPRAAALRRSVLDVLEGIATAAPRAPKRLEKQQHDLPAPLAFNAELARCVGFTTPGASNR